MVTYTLRVTDSHDRALATDHADTIAGITDKTRDQLRRHLGRNIVRAYISGSDGADWYTSCRYPLATDEHLGAEIENIVHGLHARLHWLADYPGDAGEIARRDTQSGSLPPPATPGNSASAADECMST